MPDDKMEDLILKDTSFQIIGAIIEVHTVLGYGFLESVYEKALMKELALRGLKAENQKEIVVSYKGEIVGHYAADIVVNDEILLELKSVECLINSHKAQILNYLKATKYKVGLLVNFGKERAEYKRFVM